MIECSDEPGYFRCPRPVPNRAFSAPQRVRWSALCGGEVRTWDVHTLREYIEEPEAGRATLIVMSYLPEANLRVSVRVISDWARRWLPIGGIRRASLVAWRIVPVSYRLVRENERRVWRVPRHNREGKT